MSVGKPITRDSSKQLWRHIKSSGEEELTYTHNPYDDSPNRRKEREKSLNVCRHYAEGRCNRGSTCRFHHETRHNIIVTPHVTPKFSSIAPLKGLPTSPLGAYLSSPPNRSCNGCLLSPTHHNNSMSYNSSTNSSMKILSESSSTIPHLQLPESLSTHCRSSTYVASGMNGEQPPHDVLILSSSLGSLNVGDHVSRNNGGFLLTAQQR
ncbi:zinc finger protein family member, putative [Trypanosoma equiperdum]|uniref:C3H1-type domain-containing protein n=4 Tax=Trypanozoon TaxID=39700 RepID=Q384H2_TRYB2|nr:hypothetical protein, conserved [Trypanosoma brucei gambiense DAL972]XP_828921.1 hypothetical protein, conserved [Trypanosoma brucei brucei TREU927]RHW68131.1 zinc finger protein family member [Trypanosoma brucei equiperdum]SCU71194.1 zinc finger protein family member, putative [Trypanosoma equiperdum]EAN79809.1 hypothetical protein, conserved [Trypanosoma brucei brucei TREU927]CBH17845.1 hypothetical protein, conserved [Trypanosoma brucei gambiense DAL972]|eukprot:XP_011780109.1 hypothetical protein, conserved [Trypanosoma brucei gambiense DAL972]